MDSKLLKDDVTPEEEVEGELDPRVQVIFKFCCIE